MGDHEIVEYRHPAALLRRGPRGDARGAQRRHRGVRHRPPPADPQLPARRDRPARPARRSSSLRDLGPLPGRQRSTSTIWDEGHAGRPRRRRHPDPARRHRDRRAGQRRAGGLLHDGRRGRRARVEGVELQIAKAKAAVILRPDGARRHHPGPGPRELGGRRHPLLLQDLHPRRLPDLAVRAADPPPALPLPPVDVRPRRQRQGHLRPGRPCRCPSCRWRSTTRATSIAQSDFPNPSDRASGSVADHDDTSKVANSNGDDGRHGQEAEQGRRRRQLGRRAPRPRHAGEEEPAQGLPRPLVVHARRDRAVELRRPAPHRRLPDPVVQAEHGRGRSTTAPTTSCAASTCPRPTPRPWTSRSTSAAAC